MLGINSWQTIVLAAGALGTAAFGIVEGLKWTPLGSAGYGMILKHIGALRSALEVAFGDELDDLLEGLYRSERTEGSLPRTLRQGVRIGLTPDNAPQVAAFLTVIDSEALARVAGKIQDGEQLDDTERAILGRFQLAADARIDSALARAENRYVGMMRLAATIAALVISIGAWLIDGMPAGYFLWSLVLGLAAVPLAPIAKDVAKAIQSASTAFRVRASSQ